MYKKRKSFFSNKKCVYCSKKATTFRLIKGRHEMLCDDIKCNFKSKIKAGLFGIELKRKR